MSTTPETEAGQSLEQGFQLEELWVDPVEGEIVGPGGREQLDPKVMGVLVLIARHAGHVVAREELLARLWPNMIVTDDALTRCFYELRRQLSLAGGNERYKAMVETLPKRGYRLNAAISLPERQPVPPARDRKPWPLFAKAAAIPAAILLLILVAQRFAGAPAGPQDGTPASGSYSIAVLPFADMSAEQNQGYFSDGISEEILNRLTQTRSLRVIARTSSFSFRDQSVDIPEIAAKLDVTHVLEGSVRRSGDRVRITAQLVEASSNSQLWSEVYDREAGDLFAIQDEIAAAVATALRITLASASRNVVPPHAEAYELFLQGEFLYNRRGPGDVALAAKYYHDALAIDPGYARAWAALAGAYSLLAYSGEMPSDEALAKQGEAARKAIELDPGLAVGHARYSQYHWDIGDRDTGYRIWDKARALDPDDPLILNFTAGLAMRAGDIATGIETQRRLVARDPLSASYHANLGAYLLAADRLEDAKSELLKAQELNPSLGPRIDLAIARILILEQRLDEARALIEKLPEGEDRDHGLALLYHASGRPQEADAALDRLAAQSQVPVDIRLAEVYAFRGMTEDAFDTLATLAELVERDEPSLTSQVWTWQLELRVSPFLKPLHADPRWTAMLFEPREPGAGA